MKKKKEGVRKKKRKDLKREGKRGPGKRVAGKKTATPKSKAKAAPKKTAAPVKATVAKAKKPSQTKIELNRAHRKVRVGRVVSDKMEKTVIVTVERQFSHKFYKKMNKKTKRFVVHDEENKANIGDTVEIMETRPLSKLKRWRLINIIEKSK